MCACVSVCLFVCLSVRPSIHYKYVFIACVVLSLRHTVKSGRWDKFNLMTQGQHSSTSAVSLRDAVGIWLTTANETHPVEFRDSCYTAHCNELCPEEINFELGDSHLWENSYKIFIYCIVGTVTLVCITLKGIFYIWHKWLLKNQELFLERSSKDNEAGITTTFQVR